MWLNELCGQKRRQGRDPSRTYEEVLDKKRRAYEALKQAVAGILYLRNKIEGEIRDRRAEMGRIHDEIRRALELGEESEALDLVRQKQTLAAEVVRAEADLEDAGREADQAKTRLLEARDEIRELERERVRVMTALAGAKARARVGDALDEISGERTAWALEQAREEVQRIQVEASLERELSGASLEEQIMRAASDEIDAAKRELLALKERFLGGRRLLKSEAG